jgi:anti-sigma B factor antagonist
VEIEIRTEMDRAVLTVKGDWIGLREPALEGMVNDLLAKGARHFTLRMDEVGYVDSAGLGHIVQVFLMVKRKGGQLELVGMTDRLTSRLRHAKLLVSRESDNLAGVPDLFGIRLPTVNPVFWLVLVATLAILGMIAGRAAFNAW